MGTQKSQFFSNKFEFWLVLKSWNHLSFVNISPTLVIDTSIKKSSRLLHHENPKIRIYFQKSSKFGFWLVRKSWNHLSFVNISRTLQVDTSMERYSRVLHHGKLETIIFSKKVWNLTLNFYFDSCRTAEFSLALSILILNWWLLICYINGNIFMSTTTWKHKNWFLFSKKFKIDFWLVFSLAFF